MTDFDLSQLCALAGVTERTVRYYIQQGLLPGPNHPGPGARYGEGNLARLRAIRALQRDHLPLAEIRRRLGALGDDEVAALVSSGSAGTSPPQPVAVAGAPSAAVDYVRSVLGGTALPPPTPLPAPGAPSPPRPTPGQRSQWERVQLSDDVEIHVRRPLAREDNRRVERLLEEARRIFEDRKP